MYELPGMENVAKVVIDEATIDGSGKPLLIYSEQPQGIGLELTSAAASKPGPNQACLKSVPGIPYPR